MASMGGAFPGDALGADFDKFSGKVNANTQAVVANGGSLLTLANRARAVMGTIGWIAGAVYSAKAVYDMGRMGSEIEYTRQKFDRLSIAAGTTGDTLLSELRTATRGTLSDFQLTKQGTDLFQLGLAKTSDEAVRLSTVMTALGMDTGELTLALANQSKRRLDQLGLSLTEFNKNEAILKASGLGKEDAFTQAFLITAEQTVERVGNKGDSAAGSYDRLTASWGNWTNSMRENLNVFQPFNNAVSKGLDNSTKQVKLNDQYQEYLKTTRKSLAERMGAGATDTGGWGYDVFLQDPGYLLNPSVDKGFQEWQNKQRSNSASTARYTGLANLYNGGGGAQTAASAPDYGNLLKVGRALTDVTGNYNDKLNQLAEKLIDAPKKYGATAEQAENLKNSLTGLDSMTDIYNSSLMQELQSLTAANGAYAENDARVRELREGITRLKESAIEAGNEMLLSTMANAGATDEQQLGFARASGMISEQAFQQSMALNKISQAYLSNQITAEQAANAGRNVINSLASINGFNAVAYVDIYIRTHGGGAGFANIVGDTSYYSPVQAAAAKSHAGNVGLIGKGNATGGAAPANSITGITEYGEPEIYTSGGKQYLVAGRHGGYVSPMNAAGGNGNWQQMHALVSRIPSAEETARAIVKAMRAA